MYEVRTLVGTGQTGFADDAGSGAIFNSPTGIVVDRDAGACMRAHRPPVVREQPPLAGFAYVVDTSNQRIRRIDLATLEVTTVAGSGDVGWSGDGGPALAASFSFPQVCLILINHFLI
jgi:hypothetical protein